MLEGGVTFNQWCAGKDLNSRDRLAFEPVWNALIGGGHSPSDAGHMLRDIYDLIQRKAHRGDWGDDD